MKSLFKRTAVLLSVMSIVFNGQMVFAAEQDSLPCDNIDIMAEDFRNIETAIECNIDLPENTDSSKNYFRFAEPQRMDANGNFTFSFSWKMSSVSFKPASSSIKVYSKATSSTSNKTYYIGVRKIGESSYTPVRYTANNTNLYYEFTGLDTNSYYCLEFSKPLTSGATITGSGSINSIQ